MTIQGDAFTKLLGAYPNSGDGRYMRTLWVDTWSSYPNSVIVRTVERVIRTWQRCPSLDEFMQEVTEEETRQSHAALRERMEACTKCDLGMVETKPNSFRPCDDCLPEGYERWCAGRYEPTHR